MRFSRAVLIGVLFTAATGSSIAIVGQPILSRVGVPSLKPAIDWAKGLFKAPSLPGLPGPMRSLNMPTVEPTHPTPRPIDPATLDEFARLTHMTPLAPLMPATPIMSTFGSTAALAARAPSYAPSALPVPVESSVVQYMLPTPVARQTQLAACTVTSPAASRRDDNRPTELALTSPATATTPADQRGSVDVLNPTVIADSAFDNTSGLILSSVGTTRSGNSAACSTVTNGHTSGYSGSGLSTDSSGPPIIGTIDSVPPPGVSIVPEPTTLLTVLAGGVLLLHRRRCQLTASSAD
ncbi:MAG: PEP-CTERM sorting domain-containing protein [Tepidisphaeraceae bacterium]